jgi:hypothetical protein
MKVPWEIKRGWEKRFPGLSGKWTHWKITGTGKFLAVVDGADLLGALRVVEENYGRFITIKANRVAADANGQIIEEEEGLHEISNLSIDEKTMSTPRADDA